MRSIERTLLVWILSALSLGALIVAFVTFLVTLDEMNEVFDADLKNVAKAVASYHHIGPASGEAHAIASPLRVDAPDSSEIVTLTWTPQGRRVFASDPRVQLPFTEAEGLSWPVVAGEAWIVYSNVSDQGVVQAAQRISAREEMSSESAAKVFPPLIGLVVVAGGLLVFGLRKGLSPLDSAMRDIAQRSAHSLTPISLADVPAEIKPLVMSINDLMMRLAMAFAVQRSFIADAAHELRTPITALRLQLQLLERAQNDSDRASALVDLGSGTSRLQRLVEQLLHVARTDHDGALMHAQPIDLVERVRYVVEAFSLKADRCSVDLGAGFPAGSASVLVLGDFEQITILLNNLVDNALKYTPSGGVVDVDAFYCDGAPALRVRDSGPGIPEAEHKVVFNRFYRRTDADAQERSRNVEGSGLGLAIVRAIADRHGATVFLHTPIEGKGLEVQVRFPVKRSSGISAPG